MPGVEIPTWTVRLALPSGASRLAAQLRQAPTPIVGRIADDAFLLDVRTLLAGDDERIVAAFAALGGGNGAT
ncbi:MAG: hypothetical protein FJZ01_27800 [Candidatus Sericytochromatia bacterium]|nr:hypothetical protein [Candidatus Tanganyikabacteria bacterium]